MTYNFCKIFNISNNLFNPVIQFNVIIPSMGKSLCGFLLGAPCKREVNDMRSSAEIL